MLGTCTPACYTTCLVSCNPFCCNSKMAAGSNIQYSAMRHAVITQANRRRFIMPGFSRYPMAPLQTMVPQARAMTVPVTLAIRCVPTVQAPCPPGTQVSQTVQGSYKMPQPRTIQGILSPKRRPIVSIPRLTLSRLPYSTNQQAFLPRVANPVQIPCIPSLYNLCPPLIRPPTKPLKVTDPPQHIIHLPPPQMQPPCTPGAFNPCPPQTGLPSSPLKLTDPPQHIIHLPPPQLQPPCIPSAFNPCPPQISPPLRPMKVTDPPQHVIHLPPPQIQPPCIPSAYNPCPQPIIPPVNPALAQSPPQQMNRLLPPQMQPPCIPSLYNRCPPQTNIPPSKLKVIDPPQHVIHLPPPQMQPPCIPSAYNPCPQPIRPPIKPALATYPPQQFMRLVPPQAQTPCIPSAYNPCPQPITPPIMPAQAKYPSPLLWPVLCIPLPNRPCPPRKLSKPSHKKGKSRAFMPKPVVSSYVVPYSNLPYWQSRVASYTPFVAPPFPVYPIRRFPTYATQNYGQQPPFQRYRSPALSQMSPIQPFGLPPWSPMPFPYFSRVTKPSLGDKPKKTLPEPPKPSQAPQPPKPIPVKGPISLQGSLTLYPKPAPIAPPFPFPPYPPGQNPFSMINPCIPSLANPCNQNTGNVPSIPPTNSYDRKSRPILLTRPLQVQGSIYLKPPPPRPFPMPPSYTSSVMNPFSRLVSPKPPNAPQIAASSHSIIVQLPEISLQTAPASLLPKPIVPPPPPSPVFPSSCPISCTHYPGVFCPSYCAKYCCKKRGRKQKSPSKTKSKKPDKNKMQKEAKAKSKEKKILKVKKAKKG